MKGQRHASWLVAISCHNSRKYPKFSDIGLNRDDGLAVLNQTPRRLKTRRKKFAEYSPITTCESPYKRIHFFDVTLDLTTERFKPYSKPATTPLYVHSKSNDPPNVIRNIPEAIKKRLSEISSDEDALKEAAPITRKHYARAGLHTNSEITVWRVATRSQGWRHDRVPEGCWTWESRCSQATGKKKTSNIDSY